MMLYTFQLFQLTKLKQNYIINQHIQEKNLISLVTPLGTAKENE